MYIIEIYICNWHGGSKAFWEGMWMHSWVVWTITILKNSIPINPLYKFSTIRSPGYKNNLGSTGHLLFWFNLNTLANQGFPGKVILRVWCGKTLGRARWEEELMYLLPWGWRLERMPVILWVTSWQWLRWNCPPNVQGTDKTQRCNSTIPNLLIHLTKHGPVSGKKKQTDNLVVWQ